LQHKGFQSISKTASDDSTSSTEQNESGEAKPTVYIMLDAATLQAFTRPFRFSDKHKNREPLYIQESSFGWYEFIKFGVLSPDDATIFSLLNAKDASTYKYHMGNIIPPKWRSIWSMLTNPFQRLWFLFRLTFCFSNGLHSGLRMIDSVSVRNVWALLFYLRDLNKTQNNVIHSTQKNRGMKLQV
jgi:hypothetical protein